MRGKARGRIATAPPARRGCARPTDVTKREKGEDDDGDIMATSARAPLVSIYARARSRWQRPVGAWAALGPKGSADQKRGWQPTKGKKGFLITLTLLTN
jgi:hypothetical protein